MARKIDLCCVLSALDIHQQDSYVQLKSSECDSNDPAQWRFIVQKHPEWFEIRKKAHVTCRTCRVALGYVEEATILFRCCYPWQEQVYIYLTPRAKYGVWHP
jgi:hypothetical protein